MHFNLFAARPTKNMDILITLDKRGNVYVATITDRKKWVTLREYESIHYESAKNVFDLYCREFEVRPGFITEADTAEAYACIDSQHD